MEKLGVPCLAMYPEEEDIQFYMETKKTPLEEFFQNKYFERGSLSDIHSGTLKEKYRNLTASQISILCDGLDCFGGEIQIDRESGYFRANIWKD